MVGPTPKMMAPESAKTASILKLLPFFGALAAYFLLVRDPHGQPWTTVLKCLPIMFLAMYICMNDFSCKKSYSLRILLGLSFSCVGDALLNVDLFPHGMCAFAGAQLCYILALGWTPLHLDVAIPLYLCGATSVIIFFNNLTDTLKVGLPLYAWLLLTMCWRSIVRGISKQDALSIFCAVGSVSFVISDSLIAFNMFFVVLPNAQIWIMITYYLAQFAITASTMDEKVPIDEKTSTDEKTPPDESERYWKSVKEHEIHE